MQIAAYLKRKQQTVGILRKKLLNKLLSILREIKKIKRYESKQTLFLLIYNIALYFYSNTSVITNSLL